MRVGADSGPESLLHLAMTDAGLPEPELQVTLRTGDARSPSADLADDFQKAIVKIKRALRNSWVDHPHASGFAGR